jgi:hypothetical protein
MPDWTQSAKGNWTQDAPETKWTNLEESAAILKAIFPNYPLLNPCKPYDGKVVLTSSAAEKSRSHK